MQWNYIDDFHFDETGICNDTMFYYFKGNRTIIDDLFPNKYPEAIETILCIEKDEDGFLTSISPVYKGSDDNNDYEWSDIGLLQNTIDELLKKVPDKNIESITDDIELD